MSMFLGLVAALLSSAQAITLGGTATTDRATWTASILKVDALNNTLFWHTCNGMLLNTTGLVSSDRLWVLTSARCFEDSLDVTQYKVQMGARHVYTDTGASDVQTIDVQKIMRHELYNFNADPQAYDIALVRMTGRATLNARVGVVYIPGNEHFRDRTCYLSGYGKKSFTESDDPIEWNQCSNLQFATTTEILNTDCQVEYQSLLSSMLCASTTDADGLPSFPSPCGERDYGSPLVCNSGTSTSPVYKAAGVSVYQWPGQNCGEAPTSTPTPTFTRVVSFRQWITDTVTMYT